MTARNPRKSRTWTAAERISLRKLIAAEIDKRLAAAFIEIATTGSYATDIHPFRSDFGRIAKRLACKKEGRT